MGQSAQTKHMLTKTQAFYDNNLKQALGFQNPLYPNKSQQIRSILYDSNVIAKETNVISIADSEETLMLEEENRSKMLLKQNFGKRFVLQQEMFDEQALHPIIDQSASSPVKIEAPRELPKEPDIVNIIVNSSMDPNTSVNVNSSVAMIESMNNVEICNNKEIFQKNNTSVNQTEPSFDQLFELNNLKTELHAKDTTIKKLKAHIKRVSETSTSESVKKDLDEIETINIELEHRVTRLIVENQHLKQTYKQLYDSIKPSCVHIKERTKPLVNQVNQKSVKFFDLNAQLQEKVFIITTLKNDLRKSKRKDTVDNVAQMSNATTMAPGMYKLDPIILAPRVMNNKETHEYYLKHTIKQAAILREVVEQAKSQNPLDITSYSACVMNVRDKFASKKNKKRKEWKPTGKVFNFVRYKWKPTERTFILVGNVCPLTRITAANKVPLRVPIHLEVVTPEHVVTRVYTKRPKVVQIALWYLDSGCSKHMTRDRSQLTNFVHKFLGTVKFGND
nr:integrase, catalytic region, zinc finger, CCHC-type, peptidase aspartic, catalytic [Tanacetum cinerariifolium]